MAHKMAMLNEYAIVGLRGVPQPRPFREPCMIEPPARQCGCWYHLIDWINASRYACLVVTKLGRVIDGHSVERIIQNLLVDARTQSGAISLFVDPIVISAPLDDSLRGYINGQHRMQAMLDQGVEFTVVEKNPPSDARIL